MSNLGGYQKVVTVIKKVGGPKKAGMLLGGAIVTAAFVSGGCGYAIGKKSRKLNDYNVFRFIKDAEYDDESFVKGEKYIVLEIDGDAAIIMKSNNLKHPFVVSYEFLKKNTNISESDIN